MIRAFFSHIRSHNYHFARIISCFFFHFYSQAKEDQAENLLTCFVKCLYNSFHLRIYLLFKLRFLFMFFITRRIK